MYSSLMPKNYSGHIAWARDDSLLFVSVFSKTMFVFFFVLDPKFCKQPAMAEPYFLLPGLGK